MRYGSTLSKPRVLLVEDDRSLGRTLAERLEKEAKTDDDRINRAYRLALGRAPTAKELERARAFLKDSPLSELCRALMNLNEFVYLD